MSPASTTAHSPVAPPRQHRYGIVHPRIGASFRVRNPAGQWMVVQTRDRSRHLEHAANATYICLHPTCSKQEWLTLDEAVAAHPPHEDMAKAAETHIVGLFCDAPSGEVRPMADPRVTPGLDKMVRDQVAELGLVIPPNREPIPDVIGFLSDER